MGKKRKLKFVTIDRYLFEEALKIKVTGNVRTFLFTFLEQTNGFGKNFDKISWKRYTNLTGFTKSHLSDYKKALIKKGCMYEKDSILYLVEDIRKWKEFPSTGTLDKFPLKGTEVPPQGNKEFPSTGNTSESSHLNIHLKGLSTSEKKKKKEADERGLKMLKEVLKKKGKGLS